MFFEPEPAGEEPARRWPEIPPWSGPPALEAGVPLAVARTVARSDNVVVLLPPAGNFEFAVEWPLGGIELTIAELDGAAIAAASQPSYYWPAP